MISDKRFGTKFDKCICKWFLPIAECANSSVWTDSKIEGARGCWASRNEKFQSIKRSKMIRMFSNEVHDFI